MSTQTSAAIGRAVILTAALTALGCKGHPRVATGGTEPVMLANYVRAETDVAIGNAQEETGFSRFLHVRTPSQLNHQAVVRMSRDTLYSAAVVDLKRPVVVTLPEADGRYMSLHVINQDHYSFAVSGPGRYELTAEQVGSQYAFLTVRTFVQAPDPEDIEIANRLQDAIAIEGGGQGPLALPDWNMEQLLVARDALRVLAKLGTGKARAFGTQAETDPVEHLVHTAAGWGGLPQQNEHYVIAAVPANDGRPHAVTVRDVPVDAFWSITVYNADGFIDRRSQGLHSLNDVAAVPDADGAITVHFGGCKDGRLNCLPIFEGWNYVVRLYEPRPEILDGSWAFPDPVPVP